MGANLQSLQAEADNKIAQARAEERRAMAVALEQEMRAAVVQAEAEIPKAMAQALREGHIGVVDYYTPEVGAISPQIIFISTVLPLPFLPISPTIEPRSIVRSTLFTTVYSLYFFVTF